MKRLYLIRVFSALLLAAALVPAASAAELKQKTNSAFDRYVAATEARFANELRPGGTFLYIDGMNPDARRRLMTSSSMARSWWKNWKPKLPA